MTVQCFVAVCKTIGNIKVNLDTFIFWLEITRLLFADKLYKVVQMNLAYIVNMLKVL